MPLEDLIPLGFQVSRTPEGVPPGGMVSGFGHSWALPIDSWDEDGTFVPARSEEEIVAEAKNHKALYDKMTSDAQHFADNFTNWSTLTAQQKDVANRQAQRTLANLIRMQRNDLTSGGV